MKLIDEQINAFIDISTKRISDMIYASNTNKTNIIKINVNKKLIKSILHEELNKLLINT